MYFEIYNAIFKYYKLYCMLWRICGVIGPSLVHNIYQEICLLK
jgi:hypothetical protein